MLSKYCLWIHHCITDPPPDQVINSTTKHANITYVTGFTRRDSSMYW